MSTGQHNHRGMGAGKPRDRLLRRTTLHNEIALRLRDMIQDGELPPGSRIPELELCETFGISRTPLREALKVLVAEGLVVHVPNRGFRVAAVEADEIAAMFELMGALEELAGQLFCTRATDTEIERLLRMHQDMARFHRQGKRAPYFRLNQEIHQGLVDCTANPVLASTYASLATLIARARSLANFSQLRWDESLREHEQFMQALEQRDGPRLGRQLREHSDNTAAVVLKALRELEAGENQQSSGTAR
jgi:DNA-binding GntR family transcriptional regulator